MMGSLLLAAAMLQDATVGGATVWVWALDGRPATLPKVAPGLTPNAYLILPSLDVTKGFDSQEGRLESDFAGRAFGWLRVPAAGRYRFRLTCDDGAQLRLGGRTIVSTNSADGFVQQGITELAQGDIPMEISFFQRGGNFSLKLEWQRPGAAGFEVIGPENLRSEAGQTLVVSPGKKRWFVGEDPRRPGDGRALEGVHPAFRLETVRPPTFTPAVGGMCFLPDGRLAICTWDQVGAVYILSGLNGPPEKIVAKRFAEGLGEPLGIAWHAGDLYVTQKREVTRLRDTDRDGVADEYEAISEGWPMSHNYHEFTFNLVPRNGKFYIATSVPLRGGWTYYNPGSQPAYPVPGAAGSILEIDPKSGAWKIIADGLRTPNGMGIGVDGEMFVADNQGSWLPCSRIDWVRPGAFYGHQMTPDGDRKAVPPTLWLPQGEIGNSPSEPTLVKQGTYRGQMLFGDVTHGGVKRAFLEKIDGQYQGCVFRFTQGIEAGVNRLAWGPDGALYLGCIGSNGNWNHLNHRFGLQRLVPNGRGAFEMLRVRLQRDGFAVDFTEPVMQGAEVEATRWRYEPKELYGGPKVDVERLSAQTVWEDGRRRARVRVTGLEPGWVYHLRWKGAKNAAGQEMWSTETWYTLNRMVTR